MISNLDLKNRCKEYIQTDPTKTHLDGLVENALVMAYREICNLGFQPLSWHRENYDEIFTRYYATISAITAADPGVITCDSADPDLSDDHGFQTADIVYLDGINGANSNHRLNNRLFRAVRASATTLTLKTLDGETEIDTSDYEAYSSGGTIYHAGIVIPKTSIEPSGGTAAYEWDIKRVYGVQFDLQPADPVGEIPARPRPGARPRKWRYQQYAYGAFSAVEHLLFWYDFPSQRYNVNVLIEKEYPDPSTWTASVYLPCPAHIQEFVWHRALSNLAMHAEKQRRNTKDGGHNTKIEILNANYWISVAAQDEVKVLEYSRKLSGNQPYMSQGMSA